jgi:hypothetical protein
MATQKSQQDAIKKVAAPHSSMAAATNATTSAARPGVKASHADESDYSDDWGADAALDEK